MAHAIQHILEPTAEDKIRGLARQYGVVVKRTALDEWADDVTRLADDDVDLDNVELLVVALGRAQVMDGIELTRLHARYLDEISHSA